MDYCSADTRTIWARSAILEEARYEIMKRMGREYEKLETLNLYSLLDLGETLNITDARRTKSFLARMNAGLESALKQESTLHGIRVQTMFHLMVASLDTVCLIKQEDSGECYYTGARHLQIPDFRVVLRNGSVLLIEAKNHYRADPLCPFKMRTSDLEALERYASLTQVPLKLAIYWARWNTWTLIDPRILKHEGNKATLAFVDAFIASEMADLGDYTLGTRPPLAVKFIAAEDRPRSLPDDEQVSIHISAIETYCGNDVIEDPVEKNIALYLMFYGKWRERGPCVEVNPDGSIHAIVFLFDAEHEHPNQGFEMVGSLSSMFSAFYNSLTLQEGKVVDLLHCVDPGALAPIIPRDYHGRVLPLWRFIQQPTDVSQGA